MITLTTNSDNLLQSAEEVDVLQGIEVRMLVEFLLGLFSVCIIDFYIIIGGEGGFIVLICFSSISHDLFVKFCEIGGPNKQTNKQNFYHDLPTLKLSDQIQLYKFKLLFPIPIVIPFPLLISQKLIPYLYFSQQCLC